MKIKRSVLEKIIREELRSHIKELMMNEAPKDGKNKVPAMVDANDEKKKKEKPGGKGDEAPTRPQAASEPVQQSKGKETPKNDKAGAKQELPVAKDPVDPELDKDVADPAAEEDSEDVTGGKIADEISGKTIQSVTMEPKSKILPGAQEITLTFREIPDPLKILITKSGAVKFHFKGIHNEL